MVLDANGQPGKAKPPRRCNEQQRQDACFNQEPESGPGGALHWQQLEPKPHHELRFRFFDLNVCFCSDSRTHIDFFSATYARFRVSDRQTSVSHPLEIILLTSPDNPWRQPVLIVDGDAWPLSNPTLLEGWVYDGILNNIIGRVRSHFLIHAGVVAWQDRGLVLPGDGGHGKTTLVLELVRRGFRFLSDEMAALGRADRLVHPFPRSLRVRPDTLARVGCREAATGASTWMGKLLLDIEDLHPGSMGAPVNTSHVVVLQDPAQTMQPASSDGAERGLNIWFDRIDQQLLAAIRQIPGVKPVRMAPTGQFPVIRVTTSHPMAALLAIEQICGRQRVLLLNAVTSAQSQPCFEGPARLQPLTKSQGALQLLRRFQGGLGAALLQEEFGGSSARFLWEMTGLVAQAACYSLAIGPLEQMADLICALVQTGD